MTARRLVLSFPGFEPLPVDVHCDRFAREARRTAPVFGMDLAISEPVVHAEPGHVATGRFAVDASGEGWRTRSEIVIFGLGDVFAVYAARGLATRIGSGLLGLADFVVTGTVWRYLVTSWRYMFFVLYPIAVVTVLLGASAGVGIAVAGASSVLLGWLAGCAALAALGGLVLLAEGTLHFLLIMDDWTFARDLVREARPAVRGLLATIAADSAQLIRAADADETIVVAHSIGAVVAAEVLASALSEGAARQPVGLLTVGSSLLKVGLHPSARHLRESVRELARRRIPWLDVQAHTDVLNFFGAHPAKLLTGGDAGGCVTTGVRFRHQLSDARYRAIRRNFFRVHRQFVYGVERRTGYAYHAILCGPEPFDEVVRNAGLAAEWPAAPDASGARVP